MFGVSRYTIFGFASSLNRVLVFMLFPLLVASMVTEAKGRIFRRKDGKYLIYVPVKLAEDSMFPFPTKSGVTVKISFEVGDDKLQVEKWNQEED
jgi:hypothetical protein